MSSRTLVQRLHRICLGALGGALAVLLAACAGASAALNSAGLSPAVLLAGLPPLPTDEALSRQAAVVQPSVINGADFFEKSAGATVDGSTLQLASAAQALEWAIYSFDTAGHPALHMQVDFATQSGEQVWLAVSDYARQSWELHGPYSSATLQTLTTDNVSSGGLLHFAVLVFDGTAITINTATVNTDVPAEFGIDITNSFSFDPQTANVDAGTTVTWHNIGSFKHTVTVDALNVDPGGPNSDIEFPTGLSSGDTYSFQVPEDATSGTQWFYRCRFHGTAGDGTSMGTGMVGVVIVN
jgi:plastocyanin